jgi:hypothetical protein
MKWPWTKRIQTHDSERQLDKLGPSKEAISTLVYRTLTDQHTKRSQEAFHAKIRKIDDEAAEHTIPQPPKL